MFKLFELCRFNDHGNAATQAIEDVHQRACYQCYSDVLLVTNSIKNSSHFVRPGELFIHILRSYFKTIVLS